MRELTHLCGQIAHAVRVIRVTCHCAAATHPSKKLEPLLPASLLDELRETGSDHFIRWGTRHTPSSALEAVRKLAAAPEPALVPYVAAFGLIASAQGRAAAETLLANIFGSLESAAILELDQSLRRSRLLPTRGARWSSITVTQVHALNGTGAGALAAAAFARNADLIVRIWEWTRSDHSVLLRWVVEYLKTPDVVREAAAVLDTAPVATRRTLYRLLIENRSAAESFLPYALIDSDPLSRLRALRVAGRCLRAELFRDAVTHALRDRFAPVRLVAARGLEARSIEETRPIYVDCGSCC